MVEMVLEMVQQVVLVVELLVVAFQEVQVLLIKVMQEVVHQMVHQQKVLVVVAEQEQLEVMELHLPLEKAVMV